MGHWVVLHVPTLRGIAVSPNECQKDRYKFELGILVSVSRYGQYIILYHGSLPFSNCIGMRADKVL